MTNPSTIPVKTSGTIPNTIPSASPASPIRVVLAEDDPSASETIAEILSAHGHSVVGVVQSGEEAVARTLSERPDAVLLDLHMPGMSGAEAAESIAQSSPGTAVLLFTGDRAWIERGVDAERTRAWALLEKPVSSRVLDTTLRMTVARARELDVAKQDAQRARTELENRKLIERAKGILMRRTGTSEQEAYRIMQRSSQDRSKPMVDIARAVITSEPGATKPQ